MRTLARHDRRGPRVRLELLRGPVVGTRGDEPDASAATRDLEFYNNVWSGLLRVEDYQTIDDTILATDDPYQTLPQLAVRGFTPEGWLGLQYALDAEVAHYTRSNSVTGVRGHVMPEISLPLDLRLMTVEPAVAYDYTLYRLSDTAPGQDKSPSRDAPVFSIDVATTLERLTPKRGWLQTLEPRVQYAYIPFRNQDDLPVFDTITADLNVVQLFRREPFRRLRPPGRYEPVEHGHYVTPDQRRWRR